MGTVNQGNFIIDSDEWYRSYGLDPGQQRKKTQELNGKRKSIKVKEDPVVDYDQMNKETMRVINQPIKKRTNIAPNIKKEKRVFSQKTIPDLERVDSIAETVEETPRMKQKKLESDPIKDHTAEVKGKSDMGSSTNAKKVSGDGFFKKKAGIAAAVIGGAILMNDLYEDHHYQQQIAKDISSYRYGKKMTGYNQG